MQATHDLMTQVLSILLTHPGRSRPPALEQLLDFLWIFLVSVMNVVELLNSRYSTFSAWFGSASVLGALLRWAGWDD